MPQVIIALFLALTVCLQAQMLKVEKIKGNEVSLLLSNDTQKDISLSVNKGKLVFLKIELWDFDSGYRLITKDLMAISDGGGFTPLDALILKPKESKTLKIDLASFQAQSEQGKKFLERFLKRGKNSNYYEFRLILEVEDNQVASKLSKITQTQHKPR